MVFVKQVLSWFFSMLALISINIGKNHLIGSFQRLLMLKQNYS